MAEGGEGTAVIWALRGISWAIGVGDRDRRFAGAICGGDRDRRSAGTIEAGD
ncbi:hypothetical protein [Prochlorothrix hollandica]|uniref:hypothetical protein n=1 Tax=Prochlorothrix hollandica TaxID=1223 RepID=UPI00035ED61D|nr:hypothetical protein [Prochlorothrix hollandica]